MTPLEKTLNAVRTLLADVEAHYTLDGGDGIGAIRRTASNTYEITLLQEERADIWTYDIAFDGDTVRILDRRETTSR